MENLGVDGKLLLAQLVNFVLFFIIFKKFIAKPFGQFLSKEKKNEKDKEVLLNKLKKGEEELASEEKALRDRLKKERNQVLEKAKSEALLLKNDLVAEGKKDADALLVKARKEIEEEKNKLYQDAKNKVADLSILMVQTALNEYLDEESKKRITSHILKNVNSLTKSL